MKTHEGGLLGGWVRRFLLEHLVVERNLSRNTQRSYGDTLRLLIPFAADHQKTAVDRLVVTEVSADVVRGFLRHVEERRGCGVRTRNQRLAAIHALATFVGERCPELIPWCGEGPCGTVQALRPARTVLSRQARDPSLLQFLHSL
jgi:integrase/recombinase XerD